MDYENTIRSLKKQLFIERIIFGAFVLVVAITFIAGWLNSGKSVILVDGKPVVCVDSVQKANEILENIKKDSGANPIETEFKEEVRVARAPREATVMPTSRALSVARTHISPVVQRWAIIADSKPIVALSSKEDCAKTLEMAKAKFGAMVQNLSEEPQFKENVSIAKAAVCPEQYCKDPEAALEYLFAPKNDERLDTVHIVREGDVAVGIAKKFKLTAGELKTLNPGTNLDKLSIGHKLKVKETKTPEYPLTIIVRNLVTKTEQMNPEMVRVSSPVMYTGKTAYISRGKPGKREISIATVYENGKVIGEEIVSEQVLVTPVAGKLAVGIKPRP